ncbi:MAG TPA: hypothetical protein VGX45_14670 [Solirubrobacteraceae bacterium]|jgi:hypothetical protein|nr:hypothetical protein [Solirubrobacteraceae bacterium]
MRRIGLFTVAAALTATAVALAATYKTGLYSAGFPSTHSPGINLTIRKRSFSVQVMSFHERCTSSQGSFSDWFEFRSGGSAQLTGTVSANGTLSGKWVSSSGTDKVSGTVHGSNAMVKGSEDTTYQPHANGAVYTCKGSRTFRATHLQTTGG